MSDSSDEPSETTRLMSANRARPQSPRDNAAVDEEMNREENGEVAVRRGLTFAICYPIHVQSY